MKTIKEWKEEHGLDDLDKWLPLESDMSRDRLSVCAGCLSFNASTGVCNECSCYIPAKCRFSFLHCPLGKWDKELTKKT